MGNTLLMPIDRVFLFRFDFDKSCSGGSLESRQNEIRQNYENKPSLVTVNPFSEILDPPLSACPFVLLHAIGHHLSSG